MNKVLLLIVLVLLLWLAMSGRLGNAFNVLRQ